MPCCFWMVNSNSISAVAAMTDFFSHSNEMSRLKIGTASFFNRPKEWSQQSCWVKGVNSSLFVDISKWIEIDCSNGKFWFCQHLRLDLPSIFYSLVKKFLAGCRLKNTNRLTMLLWSFEAVIVVGVGLIFLFSSPAFLNIVTWRLKIKTIRHDAWWL